MQEGALAFACPKDGRSVSFVCSAPYLVLVNHELETQRRKRQSVSLVSQPLAQRRDRTYTFETDRTPRMCLSRTDSNFRSESIPEPVCEPRTRIDVDSRRIDSSTECLRIRIILGHDRIRVVRRVVVDVLNRDREGRDRFDCEDQVEELGLVIFGRGRRYEFREGRVGRDGRV